MISRLHVQGIQCHKDKVIDLDPHITVLVGDNGSGKSALVRALKWWARNKWDGKADQMINWDMDHAQVLGIVDAFEVIRRKTKTENQYVINGAEKNAVGLKLPDEVAKIINMDETNFQEQLDPAFWFHLTSGDVAKSLNSIVNLGSIDVSLDRVAGELRTAKETVKATEQRITDLENVKESLSWTKDADTRLKELEAKAARLAEIEAGSTSLASLAAQAGELLSIRKSAKAAILEGRKAIQIGQELLRLRSNIENISTLINRVETQVRRTCEIQAKLDMTRKALAKKTVSLCKACEGTGLELRPSS